MALLILNALLLTALIAAWKCGWAITIYHPYAKYEARQKLGWHRRSLISLIRWLLSIGLFIGLLYLGGLCLPGHEAWWAISLFLLAIALSVIFAVISARNLTKKVFASLIPKGGRV